MKTIEATARPTAAQLQQIQARRDRKAAILERREGSLAADDARVRAMYRFVGR
jgi:hypothetical protein